MCQLLLTELSNDTGYCHKNTRIVNETTQKESAALCMSYNQHFNGLFVVLVAVDLLLAVLFLERRPILVELLLDLLRQPHGGHPRHQARVETGEALPLADDADVSEEGTRLCTIVAVQIIS